MGAKTGWERALSDDQRSAAIDYLRAFAILWVVWYHFVSLSIFKGGTNGVLLFFAISGYCIALSAASSASAWHFYAKRVGRLMPALVICGAITVTFKHIAPDLIDASRHVSWRDMIYGWLALPTLNLPQFNYRLPDGAYWSLLVEFQFYVLIFVIMSLGLRRHILTAVCIYVVVCVLLFRGQTSNLDFYPFFIAGLAVAEAHGRRWATAAIGIGFAFAMDMFFLFGGYLQPSAPIGLSRSLVLWLGTAALLVAATVEPPALMRRLLKPLAYIGLVSYPLYLLHQDIGAMIGRMIGMGYSDRPVARLIGLIVLPLGFIIVAGFIHAFVERPLIKPLSGLLAGIRPDRRKPAPKTA